MLTKTRQFIKTKKNFLTTTENFIQENKTNIILGSTLFFFGVGLIETFHDIKKMDTAGGLTTFFGLNVSCMSTEDKIKYVIHDSVVNCIFGAGVGYCLTRFLKRTMFAIGIIFLVRAYNIKQKYLPFE